MVDDNKKIAKLKKAVLSDELPSFRRKGRKNLVRYFYLLVLLGLNISMPMSMIERAQHKLSVDFGSEVFLLVFIFCLDAVMLPSLFFEVKGVIVAADSLTIETLFGRHVIANEDIVSLKLPKFLVWAVLRTKRGFYLINRRDIPDFEELLSLMAPKLTPGPS